MHSEAFNNPSTDLEVLMEFLERTPSGSLLVFLDDSYIRTDQGTWRWLSWEGSVVQETQHVAEVARWHNYEPTGPWAVL